MARVTRTELNQQTAKVLARVAAGEHLVITDRGHTVAALTPPPASRWEELVAAGTVTPASAHGPLPFHPVDAEESVADILDDLRADRG